MATITVDRIYKKTKKNTKLSLSECQKNEKYLYLNFVLFAYPHVLLSSKMFSQITQNQYYLKDSNIALLSMIINITYTQNNVTVYT